MPIRTGQRVGSYEILSVLGAGGMGEVYRALDTRLGRDVALKVLPEIFAADSDRVARFQREARVLAALNHPNIGAIYGLEEFGSNCALVMELVPGETLAERIAHGGPIPVAESVGIATQIAEALEAAHNSDIIHRDLKPANIKITPEGRVKVLDFGLAKPNAASSAQALSQALTLSSTSQPTEAGRVLGTPAYMSPEQAQGAALDKRSDIFSFGAVLYEMLAGRSAFRGTSTLEVLSAVLRDDPAPLNVPAPVNSIVRRCLEKDPARRFQSMAEVRAALRQVAASSAASRKITLSRRAIALMIGAACLVALGVVYAIRKGSAPAAGANYKPIQLTALGYVNHAAISPDGTRLAFEWAGPGVPSVEHLALYTKTIGEEAIQRVTEFKPGLIVPAWSPDGSQLAFQRLGKDTSGIFVVSAHGGPEKKLYSTHAAFGRSLTIAWSPDGKFIAFANAPFSGGHMALSLLSIDTQEVKQIDHNDRCLDETGPVYSHDGKYLAYNCYSASSDFAIALVRSDGSGSRILREFQGYCNGVAWMGDNKHLLFSQAQNGIETSYLRELAVADGSVRDVTSGQGYEAISISAKGDRLVFANESGGNDVIWRADVTRPQDAPVELISSTRTQNGPSYSPDGSHIVFSSDRTGSQEIWMSDANGQNLAQLTHLGQSSGSPSWSPDGKKVAFDSRTPRNDGSPHADVYVLDVAERAPKKLNVGDGEASVPTWSHNGKWIYFVSGVGGRNRIFRVGSEGGQAMAISTSPGFLPMESADGQYVYFASSTTSPATLLMASLNPIGTESRVEGIPGLSFVDNWTLVRDGIYFYPANDISTMSFFEFASKRVRPILKDQQAYFGISAAPDGRHILYAKHTIPKRDIMLIDNFR